MTSSEAKLWFLDQSAICNDKYRNMKINLNLKHDKSGMLCLYSRVRCLGHQDSQPSCYGETGGRKHWLHLSEPPRYGKGMLMILFETQKIACRKFPNTFEMNNTKNKNSQQKYKRITR